MTAPKPGRPGRGLCGVCLHEARLRIDLALARGVPVRVLSERFGLSYHSIWRHSRRHLSPALKDSLRAQTKKIVEDVETLRAREADDWLGGIVGLRGRIIALQEAAEEVGDFRGAATLLNVALRTYEVEGKHLGSLDTHHTVTVAHVMSSPHWLKVREALLAALRPHPAALADVVAALHKVEAVVAREVEEDRRAMPTPKLINGEYGEARPVIEAAHV